MYEEAFKLFKRFVSQDKLEDLFIILEFSKVKENDIAQLSSRLSSLKNKINNYTISDDNANAERNKIRESLLIFIESLKNENELIQSKNEEQDKEIYLDYLEKFIDLSDSRNWEKWTNGIFSSSEITYPNINKIKLENLINFLLTRDYSRKYLKLNKAFENFAQISHDFIFNLMKYNEIIFMKNDDWNSAIITIRKFYNNSKWNPQLYDIQFENYMFHINLILDLVLEMTRALNYIYEIAREIIDSKFELKIGFAIVQVGIIKKDSNYASMFKYRDSEKVDLYPGLTKFMEIRESRKTSFGKGIKIEYLS